MGNSNLLGIDLRFGDPGRNYEFVLCDIDYYPIEEEENKSEAIYFPAKLGLG